MRAVGSMHSSCGLYLPLFLQQLSMLFLSVLHVDDCRDECVLHLLLIVQLLPHCQLIDQLLWESTDLSLHLLETLQQLRHTETTQPWNTDETTVQKKSAWSFTNRHKLISISTAPLFHNMLISTLQFCVNIFRHNSPQKTVSILHVSKIN